MIAANNATIAAYFEYGIAVDIVTVDDAKAWAFEIIEANDHPPFEVIDIAMSGNSSELVEKLRNVSGERDIRRAGCWLLRLLRVSTTNDTTFTQRVARQAMQIVQHSNLGDEQYYQFDAIDDGFWLGSGTYGTIEQCHVDLVSELSKYQESFREGTNRSQVQ